MRPGPIDLGEVERDQQKLLSLRRAPRQQFARSPGYEALAPNLDSVSRKFFVAYSVRHCHIATIGYGMPALNGFPSLMLQLSLRGFLAWVPANCGWVEKDLGPL